MLSNNLITDHSPRLNTNLWKQSKKRTFISYLYLCNPIFKGIMWYSFSSWHGFGCMRPFLLSGFVCNCTGIEDMQMLMQTTNGWGYCCLRLSFASVGQESCEQGSASFWRHLLPCIVCNAMLTNIVWVIMETRDFKLLNPFISFSTVSCSILWNPVVFLQYYAVSLQLSDMQIMKQFTWVSDLGWNYQYI